MKRLFLAGAAFVVLAGGGVALAQMPPPGPGQGSGPHDMDHHDMEHGDMMAGRHGRWEHMEHGPRRGPPPGAAAFRFRKGDTEVDVRCSVHESTEACVAAAGSLIDKLANAQPKAP